MSAICAHPSRHASWTARPSKRWAAIVLCGVLLTLASCGSHTAAPGPASATAATIAARPPRQLASQSWEQIALPTPVSETQDFVVSPVDPALLFDCTADLQGEGPGSSPSPQPMTLWRSTDTGAHWTRSAISVSSGIGCYISIAPDEPSRITVQVPQSYSGTQLCRHDSFYLSDDWGITWRALPPPPAIAPNSAQYGSCDLQVTARHLFLVYTYDLGSAHLQVSQLERSDDDGITWTSADRGLGTDVLFFMPDIGPGDTLAMTVVPPSTPGRSYAAELWTSPDAGQTWRLESTLPDYPGAIMLAARAQSGLAWPTQGQPFYALEEEQIPSDLYREHVLQSGDGQHWSLLPVLPVSGTSSERPGILQVLAELPDGRLALWGTGPQAGPPAPDAIHEPMTNFWLWLWDPTARQWQMLTLPLPVTAFENCGLCWSAQTTVSADGVAYLYLDYASPEMIGHSPPGVFRVRLPTSA
jgi:hypothetical protein